MRKLRQRKDKKFVQARQQMWGRTGIWTRQFGFSLCHLIFFFVVQSLSCVQLSVTPWAAAHQASLSLTISHSLSFHQSPIISSLLITIALCDSWNFLQSITCSYVSWFQHPSYLWPITILFLAFSTNILGVFLGQTFMDHQYKYW